MNNIINNTMRYCAYLRKSRKDVEEEARGAGETLARHEQILKSFSDSLGIKITKFYREIVSGDSIVARPQIQLLLKEVEEGFWDGVLVVEVERLARGSTLDQGIIANTFKYSGTKILTPQKIYDPNNDADEDYFEFGLFMSRKEYKTICSRLHRGILSSVNDGKFIGYCAPYGYNKVKLQKQKGYSLEINIEESKMIKLIYELYLSGSGLKSISHKLKELGYKPKHSDIFGTTTVHNILTNPEYVGKIRYNDKETTKRMQNGKVVRIKNENNNLIIVDGLHEPIIDLTTFEKVQEIINRNKDAKVKIDYSLKNPLATILKCGKCGRSMSLVSSYSNREKRLCCRNCSPFICSTNAKLVETKLLESLKILLSNYKIDISQNTNKDIDLLIEVNSANIKNSNEELNKLNIQLSNAYDLLEQGIYSSEIFIQRSTMLKSKIYDLELHIDTLKNDRTKILKQKENKEIIIPKIKNVIDSYDLTNNIELRNKLLKSVLEKVEYTKITPKTKDDFQLKLYPKLS